MAASRWRTTPAVDPLRRDGPAPPAGCNGPDGAGCGTRVEARCCALADRPPGPLPDGEHHPDVPDPASRDLPARPSRPSSCRQEGSRLRPCPADQVQIPASNIAMACAISVTSRGVVTSTPGVSYLSITRLETGSEYLSKQSHSISNIGAGAEQPRQHRWPRTSRPWWSAIRACQPPDTK